METLIEINTKNKMITIECKNIRAVVIPEMGGGLARFDVRSQGEWLPLFRGLDDQPRSPNDLACYALLPWSNRISTNGFHWRGKYHAIPENFPGVPFPIHGNGWLTAWRVVAQSEHAVQLSLEYEGQDPFRYTAHMSWEVKADGLYAKLSVKHNGPTPMPYGAGFHPWIDRTKPATLQAIAKGVWREDKNHLPSNWQAISNMPALNFSTPQALPLDWINNIFTGWNGQARVNWPTRGVTLDIDAGPDCRYFILYCPSADAPFFCFEPVTHLIDAHNAIHPLNAGLVELQTGQSLHIAVKYRVGCQHLSQ